MRNSSANRSRLGNVNLEYGLVGCTAVLLAGAIVLIFNVDIGQRLSSANRLDAPRHLTLPADPTATLLPMIPPEDLALAGKNACPRSLCPAAPEPDVTKTR